MQEGYQGPSKYLNQRDAPLEVPFEVVKRMFEAIDADIDDRITLEELENYVNQTQVPIESNVILGMFEDAIKGRPAVNNVQKYAGLTLEEVAYQMRGRHAWDTTNKCWNIAYKPYRKQWLILALTVNERLFALQVPKVVPGKIVT